MSKKFYVKVSDFIELPYEESLMDGLVNKNHLTYLCTAKMNAGKEVLMYRQGTPIFEFFVEEEVDGKIERTIL